MKTQVRPIRAGATTVEFAVVSSAVVLLIFGVLVGGTGVFRYNEMAHLAREGARYAATHGGEYERDGIAKSTGIPSVISAKQMEDYLRPKAVALDQSKLTIAVAWSAPSSVVPKNIPSYMDTDTTLVPPGQKTIQNYVTVTVTYEWQPEVFLAGPMKLKSVSRMAMSY